MARKISFTKAEMEAVELAITDAGESVLQRHLTSLHRKMVAASAPSERTGLDPAVLVEALRRSLGTRLALPPNPGPSWWSFVGSRLKAMGVTADHVDQIARSAAAYYRKPVTLSTVLNGIPILLTRAEPPSAPIPGRREFTGEDDAS